MGTGYAITPLRDDDVTELSRFLVRGFHLPADVPSMSPEVLRWKYLGAAAAAGPVSLIARAGAEIVGHVGLCPRTFVLHAEPSREVATTHPIDWLASPEHPSVGLLLLLRGFGTTPTQYCLGGNPVAQKMFQTLGFECRSHVASYHRILRPLRRRLASGQGPLRKYLGAARDLVSIWATRYPAPPRHLELCRVETFGPDAAAVLARGPRPLLFSTRSAELLDHFLRYPAGSISGWAIQERGRTVGLAVLSVVEEGGVRHGRVVECFLEDGDATLWQSALAALTAAFGELGADEVTCFASTPWMEQALQHNGYRRAGSSDLLLRDRKRLLPADVPIHVTHLEADHAYLV